MSAEAARPDEKVITALLLGALILAAVALLREGPHYDNVIEGPRMFTTVFFTGMLVGFIGWTQAFRIVPTLRFDAPHRQPWIAALVLGIVFAIAGSWLNRTFATPTDRTFIAEIESIAEARNERSRISAKMSDGTYQRFLVPQEAAAKLQHEKMVRVTIARGALGFEFASTFEPHRL